MSKLTWSAKKEDFPTIRSLAEPEQVVANAPPPPPPPPAAQPDVQPAA